MRSLLASIFRWIIYLALLAGLVFLGFHFYQNRQQIFHYVGNQRQAFSTQAKHEGIKFGLSDRPAALSIYAPLSLQSQGLFTATRYANDDELWNDLDTRQIDFALVSLDQFARRSPLHSSLIAFPYAISEGGDNIVVSPQWDKSSTHRVACITNTTSEYLAQLLVDHYMDSSTPVQLVATPDSKSALELLRTGQVDALATTQPHLSKLLSEGYHLLPDWKAPNIIEVLVLKDSGNTAQSANVQRITEQVASMWFNRLEDMQRSPGPSYSAIAKLSGLSREEVRATLSEGIHFLSLAEAYAMLESGEIANDALKSLEYWIMSSAYTSPFSSVQYKGDELVLPAKMLERLAPRAYTAKPKPQATPERPSEPNETPSEEQSLREPIAEQKSPAYSEEPKRAIKELVPAHDAPQHGATPADPFAAPENKTIKIEGQEATVIPNSGEQ